jgi:hypothetical protein
MKIASRFLLPLELFIALVLLSWGMSGWFGAGPVHRALLVDGDNFWWGVSLCTIALGQFAVPLLELLFCRRWDNLDLLLCVTVRHWLGFVAAVAWLYVCYFIVAVMGWEVAYSLGLQAFAGVVFSIWIWVENQKVALMLDPDVPTEGLQRARCAERHELLRTR